MRVLQRCDQPCLTPEAFAEPGLGSQVWVNHLDGDAAVEHRIARLVDSGHPPTAQNPCRDVLAERLIAHRTRFLCADPDPRPCYLAVLIPRRNRPVIASIRASSAS